MDILESLRQKYEIGQILELRDMTKSDNCYLVVTDVKSYVFKRVGRLDFIKIYNKVQNVLNKNGFIQAKVISTRDQELMSLDGFSLLEYIPGDAVEKYNDEQFTSIVSYMNNYNKFLREVPFLPQEIEEINIWDKVKSVAFMCDSIESIIDHCCLDSSTQFLLRNARKIISKNVNYYSNNQKQLIHSDLGPGNVIFTDNKIQSIIDFTPEYEHELYSLSQFLYWTCLFDYQEHQSLNRIKLSLNTYYAQQDYSDVLFLYLLKACLFRIMGPSLNLIKNGTFDIRKVKSRILALENLFDIQQEIT
jgi:Ser/Thr protein kinase RdoA (MazF antagonist)